MNSKAVKKAEKNQKAQFDEKKGDRGDSLKKSDGMKGKCSDVSNLKTTRKTPLPDRGDVAITNNIAKIPKTININKTEKLHNEKNKKLIESKLKVPTDAPPQVNTAVEKMSHSKTSEINNIAGNKMKIGERIGSDKFCFRPKVLNNQNQGKNVVKPDLKNDRLKNPLNLKSVSNEIVSDSAKTENTKAESDIIKKEKNTVPHRKPMIKTVKSKHDNRVYKAVTFTDQKRTKPTILEINIPNIQVKKMKVKLVDKNLEVKTEVPDNKSTSKLSIKTKSQHCRRNRLTERIKRKKLNRCISSPDKFKKTESPPTEVAKWAPSCLNTHTKPYYEAWVNTTLAAISKMSNYDKLFLEKQNIIKTFQKSLELRDESPDLIHENCTDECYTGRIKIKQKNLSKRTRQPLITPLFDK